MDINKKKIDLIQIDDRFNEIIQKYDFGLISKRAESAQFRSISFASIAILICMFGLEAKSDSVTILFFTLSGLQTNSIILILIVISLYYLIAALYVQKFEFARHSIQKKMFGLELSELQAELGIKLKRKQHEINSELAAYLQGSEIDQKTIDDSFNDISELENQLHDAYVALDKNRISIIEPELKNAKERHDQILNSIEKISNYRFEIQKLNFESSKEYLKLIELYTFDIQKSWKTRNRILKISKYWGIGLPTAVWIQATILLILRLCDVKLIKYFEFLS